ncbi:YppG family protein [Bacillus sp. V3B]|nr:YppG family protein [Bacillus sp. V3B]
MNSEIRQHPYPLMQGMNGVHQQNWDPYMNPYFMQNNQPIQGMNPYLFQQEDQGYHQQQPMSQSSTNKPYSQTIFQNPLHSSEESYSQKQQHIQPNSYPYMNPYPKGSFITKPPSGMKTVLNSFKSQDGSLDINKMVDTAGQMMNAVSQVSSVVKGFGGMFKA